MVLFEKYRKKHNLRTCAAILVAIACVQAVLLNPLYLWISSDTLLANGGILSVLDLLIAFCNLLFYWVGLVFLLFCLIRFRKNTVAVQFAVYASATVLRYALELLSGYLMLGFPTQSDFLSDLFYLGIDVLLDLIIWGIAFLIAILSLHRSLKRAEREQSTVFATDLPFEKLLDWKQNPVLRTVAFMALIPSGMQILYRIRWDLYLGAPADAVDLMWMVLYYCSDLLTVAIGYFVLFLLLNRFAFSEIRSFRLYSQNENSSVQDPDVPRNE